MDDLLRLAEDPNAWAALATLIAMEVVLGLDNLVFIALLTNRIDERRRGLARKLGPVAGARVPPGAARFGVVGGASHGAAGHGARTRLFRARPAVAGGRPVPGLEGDDAKSTTASTRTTRMMTKSRLRRSASSPASSRSS